MTDIRIVSTNYTVNSKDGKHTIYVNVNNDGLFTIKPCFSRNSENYFNFDKSKRHIIKAIGQLFLDAATIGEEQEAEMVESKESTAIVVEGTGFGGVSMYKEDTVRPAGMKRRTGPSGPSGV